MNNTVNLLQVVNEVEEYSPRYNMLSAFRLLEVGNYLGLKPGQTVMDCGCGNGEALCLWAKYFGISGVGVEYQGIANATALAKRGGLTDKVRFVQANMQDYEVGEKRFDVAACLGASMCFGGFGPTVRELKKMIVPGGQIVIAEAFFTTHDVPGELREYEGDEPTETELFDMARAAGCEVGYYSRSSRSEWERYIFHTHKDDIERIIGLPNGPERAEAIRRHHRWQDMYLRYRQIWQRMALLTLHPVTE